MAGEYDHVVVGAGIIGSWTALNLVRSGHKVLLLEQFSEPHTRGSSHGQSRLIRTCYAEEFFAEMMPLAFEMWHQLEQKTQTKLIEYCGALLIFQNESDEKSYQACVSNMKKYCTKGFDLKETKEDLFERKLRFEQKPHAVIYDETGGVVFAHKAVLAVQELFKKLGGILWTNCQVNCVVPQGDKVELLTSKGNLVVPSVVICAGPWTKKLLVPTLIPSLPLQPTMVKVYYWKEREVGAYSHSSGFPALLNMCHEPHVYSLPSIEYPGLTKVCIHGGNPCDPDRRDQAETNIELEKSLKRFVSKHMPLLEKEPAIKETCMYTVTPDELYLIDRVPGHKNIIIGSGFSGTGFKTSPVVGRLLSEMASGKKPFLDISHYSLDRFKSL